MRLWLGLIIFCAFLLRVVGISNYPIGFTPDEASWGYDAYSLLKTGKDQWGENVQELKEWLGEWNPEEFDIDKINKKLV